MKERSEEGEEKEIGGGGEGDGWCYLLCELGEEAVETEMCWWSGAISEEERDIFDKLMKNYF